MNTKRFIFILLALLLACLGLFILQNLGRVPVNWLFWSFETRRAWLVLLLFGSGLLSGLLLAWLAGLRRRLRARHGPGE
jgi:uncharacterized integral membrane protein